MKALISQNEEMYEHFGKSMLYVILKCFWDTYNAQKNAIQAYMKYTVQNYNNSTSH